MRVEVTRAAGRRRSNLGCAAAFVICAVIFLLVSLIAAVLFVLSPGGNAAASFIHPQPGSLRWNPHDRLNVLLLGMSGQQGRASQADAIVVASLTPRSHRIELLSIPENLWVTIPGYGQGRIAEAYADGGARLALVTVESVIHVPIPYYAVIDAKVFSQVVDSLGGIDIRVGRSALEGSRVRSASKGLHATQHLNGVAALAFVQTKQAEKGGEEEAMRREQRLLLALKAQAFRPQTFFQLPIIVNAVGGSIPTNFPYNLVPTLAHQLNAVPPSHIRGAMLDQANRTVTLYGGIGQDVLLGDWQRIGSIARLLFPLDDQESRVPVEVLNGDGVPGQAAGVAAWLGKASIRVTRYSSARSFSYQHTEVLVSRGAGPAVQRAAGDVAALLQAPLNVGSAPGAAASVVVIIGHDFQDPTQQ